MSADFGARAIASRGLSRASASSRLIASSGTSVSIFSASSTAVFYPLATVRLGAGSVEPNSVLELAGLFTFAGAHSSRFWRIMIGGQLVAQSGPVATVNGQEFIQRLHIAPDRKSVIVLGQNVGGLVAPSDGQGAPFRAQSTAPVSMAIDFNADQVLTIESRPINGDQVTLNGFTVRNFALPSVANFAPSRAVAAWGHSLIAGTGDTAVPGGWVTRLLQAEPGRPVFNGGIGGQKAAEIVDRLVADHVRGRYWTVILDLARNNVSDPDMIDAVMRQIDRARAALSPGVAMIVATCTPAANEPSSTSNGQQIAAFNAQLRSRSDVITLDCFATLVNQSDGTISADRLSNDGIHWSSSGHALIQASASALLMSHGL